MRLLTRYLLRLHLPALLSASCFLTLLVLAGILLVFAGSFSAFSFEQLGGVVGALALRCLIGTAPVAVLVAVVATGLGLRAREERVALEADGVHTFDRLCVSLYVGLGVALFVGEGSRALTPGLVRAERAARLAVATHAPARGLEVLQEQAAAETLVIGVDEALGRRLAGLIVWAAPGLPAGTVVVADEGELDVLGEESLAVIALRRVELVGSSMGSRFPGSVERFSAERLEVKLQSPGQLGVELRRGHATTDQLWAARRAGGPWSAERIDVELSHRAASALLCAVMALVGFVIAERTPARREHLAWALAIGALVLLQLVAPAADSFARRVGLSARIVPWIGPATLGAAALVGWRSTRRAEG